MHWYIWTYGIKSFSGYGVIIVHPFSGSSSNICLLESLPDFFILFLCPAQSHFLRIQILS